MSWFTVRRVLTAAIREGLVYYAATAGERLARKHIRLAPPKKKPTKKRGKGAKRR